MNVRDHLKKQAERIKVLEAKLQDLREQIGSRPRSDQHVQSNFITLMSDYPANPIVLKAYADFLQLNNDDDLLKEYALGDIRSLHQSLVEANPRDVESIMEAFYFEDAVMGDRAKANRNEKLIRDLIKTTAKELDKWKKEHA